jgi:signal peptidase I
LVRDLKDLLLVLAVFMIIYILLFRVVVVVGSSMNNTLIDGDRLVLQSNVFYRNPKQGDVIVASKDSFDNGNCIIKRVIATEGQLVDIKDGIVYVDGQPLDEQYTKEYNRTFLMGGNNLDFPVIVPEGHVFVLGDNRGGSTDSRKTQIGFVDKREILGKAVFLMIPSDKDTGRIGVVD